MGVVHSMDEEQVHRISHALRDSAAAIQGINDKFDVVDTHWEKMNEHQKLVSDRIDETLDSFALMEDTFTDRVETVLKVVNYATDELTNALEDALFLLSHLDVRKKQTELPKIIIPLAMPLLVLLIELAVANAYLGILLASLPEVREKYSRYLVGNASSVLIGLSVSLLWLGGYRLWLSRKSRYLQRKGAEMKQRFDKIAENAGFKESKPETTITDESDLSKVNSRDFDDTPRRTRTSSWSDDEIKASEQSNGDPASIMPRYNARRPPVLVPHRRDDSGALQGVGSYSPARRINSEERFSVRASELGDRRKKREAALLERRRERIAALDPDSLQSSRPQRRHSDINRDANLDIEQQVRNLRARRGSQKDSTLPDSFSPKVSKRTSRLYDSRRSDGIVGSQDSDVIVGSAGSKDRFPHNSPESPLPSPTAGRDKGKIKPHVVKTGVLVNPLDMQVHWGPGNAKNDRALASRSRPQRKISKDNIAPTERQVSDPPFTTISSGDEATLAQLSDEVSARFALDGSVNNMPSEGTV